MDIVEVVKHYPTRDFVKGEVLLSEGLVSTNLLAIREGFVKVTSLDENGNERMLWIAGRYDIVPTEQLFSQSRPLRFFYTALTVGSAYQIKKNEFLHYADTNPQLMREIAASMSDHYDDLLSRVNTIGQANVHDKLIATLQYLANRFSADTIVDLYSLGLKITHNDLADMIGSTRETTSLELQKLRQSGVVQYDRTHFIVDLSKCILS